MRRVAPIRGSVLLLSLVLAFCVSVKCLRLVLAFSGSVLVLRFMLAFSGSGPFTILQKLYLSCILHLTQTRCNSLTVNALLSVGYCQLYLHATYTTYTPLTLPHDTSTGGRYHGIGRQISRHREAEKSVAPTDFSTSLWRINHRIRQNRLRDNGVGCVRCVQGCVRYFEIILHS